MRRVALLLKRMGPFRRPVCVRAAGAVKVASWLAIATATVIACGWIGVGEKSIRFNDYQTERDMGRLPPLPTLADGKNELREMWVYDELDRDPQFDPSIEGELRREEVDELWEGAAGAESSGELWRERELLREYLAGTEIARDTWFNPTNRQRRRNSAIDRLDALTALDEGAPAAAVRAYLEARKVYEDDDTSEEEVARALDAVPSDRRLSDNVAYLRAADAYVRSEFADAARSFKKLAARYPASEKREAALFMAGVAAMKSSSSFVEASGDEAHMQASAGRYDEKQPDADEPAPAAECCDAAWREARDSFRQYLAKYPRGRYSSDARGWSAYLLLRANDRAGALAEYYRLLADQTDRNAQLEAAFSLSLVRHHAKEGEMRRVERELEDEPAAALAYAYHNIYNYAIDPGCQAFYDYAENDWEARTQEEKKEALQHRELARVAAFASRLMRRYPVASGEFALRVAAANLELGENGQAEEQAALALASGLTGLDRARGLWLKGVAEHRQRNYTGARETLSTLVAENPQGQFTEGARRLLAMVAEDSGDIYSALEEYLALEYDADVAYFIDVLMTPEQLSTFIDGHPDLEKRDEFLYALGVRYMRASRWAEARQTFERVKTTGTEGSRYSYNSYDPNNRCYSGPGFERRCSDPKDTDFGPGVTARLVMSDLRTIDDLERLERAAAEAEGDEARAEALYQLASYQFESSTLLFYNPIAWHRMRHYDLAALQSSNRFRAPGEAQRMWRDMSEHEPVARALLIYMDVVRLYPRTRAARDALYTAAVCHERLSRYNEYWRNIYSLGLYPGARMVTYEDVREAYPDYQLPRATDHWEPVTRTVNGGPAWAPPPKPPTRLTPGQRLKIYAVKLWAWAASIWEGGLRYWVVSLLAFLSALFASYFAGRARRQLRAHAMGARPPRARSTAYLWLAAWRRGKLWRQMRGESKLVIRRARRRLLRLLLSRRGRQLLALNAAAHALLLVLLVLMVRAISSG